VCAVEKCWSSVPLDAFLYRRVVDAVWTRYRQEWAYGRRAVPHAVVAADALARSLPDPDLLEQMTHALDRLSEPERRLVRQLFWYGSSPDELAGVMGVSREVLMKRKVRVLRKLREVLEDPT
jgi:DNA-directed RNA polymerase specialized sigma24 family protein